MKKLFIVLAVASLGFVSCNNDSSSEEQKKIDDSIAQKHVQDSIDAAKQQAAPVTPAPDSNAMKPADTSAAKKDTAAHKMEKMDKKAAPAKKK